MSVDYGDEEMQQVPGETGTLAHLYEHSEGTDDESVDMNLLLANDQNDEDNAVRDDGTRERNLTLWEASTWQQKTYAVFEGGSFPSDVPLFTERIGVAFAFFMLIVILLSTVTVLIQSYPQYQVEDPPAIVSLLEVLCVVIFTWDMLVRFVTCPSQLKFMLDPFNYIDLIAILPFYITDIGGYDFVSELRAVRVLRLMRLLRVLRSKSVPGLAAMIEAVLTSLDGLLLFIALAAIALLVWATSAYYAERGTLDSGTGLWYRSCPTYKNCTDPRGEVSPFQSIPDSFWWATATISTVGFGDVEPTSALGQMVACFAMFTGVFILAVPTMILSGNFDAARRFGAVVNYGWTVPQKKRSGNNDSPRTRLLKRLGWYDDDLASRQDIQQLAAPTETQEDALLGGTFAGTMTRRKSKKKRKTGPQPIGAFMYRNLPRYVYRDMDANPHDYWYDPVLTIADCDDGGPALRVIWSTCNQPTMVQLTVILDCVEVREMAVQLVEGFDPNGKVRCNLGGGLEVRHFSSVRGTNADHWVMSPAKVAASYRNSDFPIYFRWTLEESELSAFTDDEVAELAVSALMGTSLHVNLLVHQEPLIHRLAIVQQVIHHTRLQRELELIAKPAEVGGDLLAFIAKDDVCALLHRVSTKVIIDQELTFEDADKLDRDIVNAVLARVRELRVHSVPKHIRSAIYDGEMLGPLTNVYEFPMSLFRADEADEVEEDALGYADVKLCGYMSRTYRVDIRIDNAPMEGPAEDDEGALADGGEVGVGYIGSEL